MQNSIINTLDDLVESYEINENEIELNNIEILPVCHTSRWQTLVNEIIPNGNRLRPQTNKNYNEELLFFFYGKAKFLPENEVKNEYKSNHPFTLVYNINNNINDIHRLVIFDSGGYPKYKISTILNHFELTNCTEEKLKKLISIFFKSNKNYISGNLTPSLDPKDFPGCGVLTDYCKIGLAIKSGDTDYGEQAVTFEIQYKDCTFNDSLIAAFVPDIMWSSEKSKEQCKKIFQNKEIIPYKVSTQVYSYCNMSSEIIKKFYPDFI